MRDLPKRILGVSLSILNFIMYTFLWLCRIFWHETRKDIDDEFNHGDEEKKIFFFIFMFGLFNIAVLLPISLVLSPFVLVFLLTDLATLVYLHIKSKL